MKHIQFIDETFLSVFASTVFKYHFSAIIGLTRKWLDTEDDKSSILKSTIPSYKTEFIQNYSDDTYDYTIMRGYPFEHFNISIGEYDQVDSLDVIAIVSKKGLGCVFLLINFIFDNESKTPITTKIQNSKPERILETLSDFPNISSLRSFLLALLSSRGILKDSEAQKCSDNEEFGSVSIDFKGNFVSVGDLIAAGAAKDREEIFYVCDDEKILFREMEREPSKFHLMKTDCEILGLEAIEKVTENHFSIIPFCNVDEGKFTDKILVNCREDQFNTLKKIWSKREIKGVAYSVMHLENKARSRKVFTDIERCEESENAIEWNLARDIIDGKKVVSVRGGSECVTIVYNHSTLDTEISPKYIEHKNLAVRRPKHQSYAATNFKVSLSKKGRLKSLGLLLVIIFFRGRYGNSLAHKK